jgi:two-component system, cell cycle sensor histidine kinase and response regulator CckA
MCARTWSPSAWLRPFRTRQISLSGLILALLVVISLPVIGWAGFIVIRLSAAERELIEGPLRHSLIDIGIAEGSVLILCGSIAVLAARTISRSTAALSAAALALGNGQQLPQLIPTLKEIDEIAASLQIAAANLARDAEQRNRAESALRETEQRFRDIAEIGGNWIWESDPEHRFVLFTSGSLEAMASSGITPAATLGKTRWELAGGNPEIEIEWRQHKADLDAHRPFRGVHYSVLTQSGARLHLTVSGKPVFDEAGMFCGYHGTATNVTDTVEALQRAERAEARLRDAVDSISEGFVIYDRDDRLVLCNESYRKLYPQGADYMVPGASYEDIIRAGLARGNFSSALGHEEEWVAARMREHRELTGAVEQQLTDGRWVLISERRMNDGGTTGLRVDITAFKAVQAELHASQEHLARAQRVAATGSFELDLATRKIEWSDETYRIFGVTRAIGPLDQTALEAMIIPEDRERLRDQIAVFAEGQSPPIAEYRIRRPDGGIRILYREVELVRDGAGQSSKLIGVVKDVTELREAERRRDELERQLMHSQKLEALGTLAGGVAHDLNNTLVPILALSKLALNDLPEDSPVRGDLGTIITASERARDLVKQILVFSRKQGLVKEEVDLARVAREGLRMLRASLPATIQIIEQISEVPPLFGDPGELHQVIVNLVTNAAQAIGGEVGKITVRIWSAGEPLALLHTSHAGSTIYLSVSDTGCGMDAATADRIFEPFFTTKEVGEGTGLGLSVVHGIATHHGGTIVVRSQPGEGAEFILSLPALDPHQTASQVEPAAA